MRYTLLISALAFSEAVLDVVLRAVVYLPLAFAIKFVLLHHATGYENYLDVAADGGIIGSDPRISYWSDLMAVSLSPSGVSQVVAIALGLGAAITLAGYIKQDLAGQLSSAKSRARGNAVVAASGPGLATKR